MNIMNQFTNRSMNQMLNNGMNHFQNMGQNAMSNIDPVAMQAIGRKVLGFAGKLLLVAAIFAGFILDILVALVIGLFIPKAYFIAKIIAFVVGIFQIACVVKLFKGGRNRQRFQRPRELHIINGKEVWK